MGDDYPDATFREVNMYGKIIYNWVYRGETYVGDEDSLKIK
jgi:hypothetical protein